jgi:hypothetical protein
MTRLRGPIATPLQSILYGIPVALIGVAISVAGGSSGLHSTKDSHATGTVLRLDHSGSTYHPGVQFVPADGPAVVFTDTVGGNPAGYKPGDTVDVVYPPGNPSDARIYSVITILLQLGLRLLCSAFFLFTGGMMIYGGLARRNPPISA